MILNRKEVSSKQNIGVYVHWPFCLSLCPYCDFNSHVATKKIAVEQWESAYIKQLELQVSQLTSINKYKLVSVFFGGGTPSLMPPQLTQSIINKICTIFNTRPNNIEITLESNPTSVEASKMQHFKDAGINRVSMGIQSFIDNDLKLMGRQHSANEAKQALGHIKKCFDNFSFDLIFARPLQKNANWVNEINEAMEYSANHISAYQLTIEKGTPFYRMQQKGELQLPTPEEMEKIYFTTQNTLANNKYHRYEVSNYCKNNQYSKHNMLYWESCDYLGIGAGAYGRITNSDGQRSELVSIHDPYKWLSSLKDDDGLQKKSIISEVEVATEVLMMGSRIANGINIKHLSNNFNFNISNYISEDNLQFLLNNKLITMQDNHIKPTEKGLNFHNVIANRLVSF